MLKKGTPFSNHIYSRSNRDTGLYGTDLVYELFHELGWQLIKFHWSDMSGSDERGILHFLAFEKCGKDQLQGIRKPWFIVLISKDPPSKADLAHYINVSWNMDFPILVVQEQQSLLLFDCCGKCTRGDPVPDVSLNICGDEGFSKRFISLFSLHEPERAGFWRQIANRYDFCDESGIERVEWSLLRILESWSDVLARKIQLASPLITADDLDSSVIKGVLHLFWYKTVHENHGGRELLKTAPPAWTLFSEDVSTPFAPDRGLYPDFWLLKRELEEKGILDTDFYFSLIPIPRIVSAFNELVKRRLRAEVAGACLPPDNAVDYCLGQVVRWRDSHPDEQMTILDPACGCGLFMSRLLSILLLQKTHRVKLSHGTAETSPAGEELILPCRPDFALIHNRHIPSGDEALETVRMLYGTDPGSSAVDVCRCMLALVIREMTLDMDWTELCGHLAEILQENIIPGDIQIGDDFCRVVEWKFPGLYSQRLTDHPGISGFHEKESRKGDFGIVTGFLGVSGSRMPKVHRHYLQTRYSAFHRDSVPASCLIERSFELLRPVGACFFVLPGGWLRSNAFRATRKLLSKNRIQSITDLSFLFKKQKEDFHYSILSASPTPPEGEVRVARVRGPPYGSLDHAVHSRTFSMPQDMLGPGGWSLIDRRLARLEKKIRNGRPSLDEYVMGRIYTGDLPGERYDDLLSRKEVGILQMRYPEETFLLYPFISEKSVSRYGTLRTDRFLLVDPAVFSSDQKTPLHCTPYQGPKLVIGAQQDGISCTFDRGGFLAGHQVLLIPGEDLFLLGVLNSRISSFYMDLLHFRHPDVDTLPLIRRLPVHVVDLGDRDEHSLYNRIVAAVIRMLRLNNSLEHDHGKDDEIRALIEEIDQEIDTLCFSLYDLSFEDIQVMRSSSGEFAI